MATNTLLIASLRRFYQTRENADILSLIVWGRSPVSLRLIEWYVSLYDRTIQNDYHNQLRAYTRRLFDPFRRSSRMVLDYEDRGIETTIGQMNFFKWLIEKGHWENIISNKDTLIQEMAKQSSMNSTEIKPQKKKQIPDDIMPLETPRKTIVWFD